MIQSTVYGWCGANGQIVSQPVEMVLSSEIGPAWVLSMKVKNAMEMKSRSAGVKTKIVPVSGVGGSVGASIMNIIVNVLIYKRMISLVKDNSFKEK